MSRLMPTSLACAALSFLLFLEGCAADLEPQSLELGTGSWRYEPVQDGDDVPLIRGAQGGWHFWLSARISGVDVSEGRFTVELQPADEHREPEQTTLDVHLDPPDAQGRRAIVGWTAIVSDPACMIGEMMRVEALFDDQKGTTLRDEYYLRITGGSDPPPPCEGQ